MCACQVCTPGVSVLSDGVCRLIAEGCPAGSYLDDNDNVCVACNPLCGNCAGPGPDNCTSCLAPFTFAEGINNSVVGTCEHSCYSAGKYSLDQNCVDCHTSCDLCVAGNASDCTTCASDKVLNDGYCVDTCPNGTFFSSENDQCLACSHGCDSCTSATVCTVCSPSFILENGTHIKCEMVA